MKNRLYKPFLLPYNYKKYNVIPGPQTFDGTVLGTISASSGEFTWDIYYGNGLIKVDGTNNWSLNNFNHQTSTGYVLRDYDIGEYSKYYVITVSFNGSVLFTYAGWGGKIRYLKNTKQFTLYKGNDTFVYRSSRVSTPTYNNWGVPTDGSFVQDVASETQIYRTDAVEIVGLYKYPVNTAPGEFVIDDSYLYGGVEYMCNINADKDITVGTTASAQIEFTTDLLNTNAAGTTLNFEQMQADETTYTQKGVFTISNIEKTRNGVYKVTAYDNVSKFDIDVKSWINSLNWSQTVNSFFKGLCTYCGVTHTYSASQTTGEFINDDIVITKNIFGGDVINGRTILGYIAAVAGGFVVADSDGDISIKHFGSTSTHTFPRAEYKKATYSDYNAAPIETVKVSNGADDTGITVGDGDNPLLIPYNAIFYNEDIDLMEVAVGKIHEKVTTYSYRPCTLELFSDYGVNVGDKITVNYGDGTFNSYVFSKKINNNGVVLESTGNPTREKLTNMGVDEVQQLVGKYNAIQTTVNGINVRTGDLEQGIEHTMVWDASGATITDQEGNEIKLGGGNIQTGSITSDTIFVNGLISFDKLSDDAKSKVGNMYRQNTIPTGTTASPLINGSYWYVTGTVVGHPEYTPGCWYTYNDTTWELTSNPNYITSTKITSTTIESPTIIGNDIIVRGDNEGAFRIQTTVDGEPVDLGRMGAGTQVVDGEVQQGIIISNNTDYGEGTMTEVGDNWVSIVPGEVRMCYSWYEGQGESRIARYRSIFIDADGAWYDDGMGEVSPIGPAVFL